MKSIYRIEIGKCGIIELPDIKEVGPNEVLVRGRMCGFCKSDVATILGHNNVPPEMFGHEGVGEVVEVGENVTEFEVGDIVASWWHPAYADYYKGTPDKFAKVKDIHPQYIAQPLGTMVNVAWHILDYYEKGKKVMVRGTGANAMLLAMALKAEGADMNDFVFVGNHNGEFFEDIANFSKPDKLEGLFDIVVDVSGRKVYNWIIKYVKDRGVVVAGANPEGGEFIDLFPYSWKAVTMVFPSPRSERFVDAFRRAAEMLNKKEVDNTVVFEKGYPREECQKAFEDSVNHKVIKAYLYW